ncbi:hypothetical protein JAAARDRAFT_165906 [Jaapia argillacea MUCL 33604]|uniref:Uncharacterized protein n=1 Tax=Jaapia argillacea MUCL 33604 TaxID=933084 RepID=A0A067QA78_9AGAM|nr:hypothetical protein JAAARDRAFT_165906 [Jaapia argillacea MUCL 33604]
MSYHNPLHASVTNNASYALTNANPRSAYCRIPVPHIPFQPASKWKSSVGRVSVGTTTFDFAGHPGLGVKIREVASRGAHGVAAMMAGAHDPVLANTGLRSIQFAITWPGYPHVEWLRSIEIVTPSGHITRSQLAALISQQYMRFIENISSSQFAQWRIGHPGLGLEHLVLMSVTNVLDDVWQATIAIERS